MTRPVARNGDMTAAMITSPIPAPPGVGMANSRYWITMWISSTSTNGACTTNPFRMTQPSTKRAPKCTTPERTAARKSSFPARQ